MNKNLYPAVLQELLDEDKLPLTQLSKYHRLTLSLITQTQQTSTRQAVLSLLYHSISVGYRRSFAQKELGNRGFSNFPTRIQTQYIYRLKACHNREFCFLLIPRTKTLNTNSPPPLMFGRALEFSSKSP